LAESGYITIAADASYQGASGGEPRNVDRPANRIEDIRGMAGSKADTYYMTDNAFNRATGTNEKELFLIEGATHIQTYYVPEYLTQAMNKLYEFFVKYL
jgi:fermentation-respiration switch protein FrsA (DUF1100 family)